MLILTLSFLFFVLDVVALPWVALEGVHFAREVSKFACRVDGCDMAYIIKYNLVCHLHVHHNVIMEPSKPKCPFTWEEGPRHQNHMAMNARVLSSPLARIHCNE